MLPEATLSRTELNVENGGIPLFEAMVKTGLYSSKGEARRLIRQGGFRINDVVYKNESDRLCWDEEIGYFILRSV